MQLIKQKKSRFYKEKLKENIGKPKELWKPLKSLGLPSKKGTISNMSLKKDVEICFDDKTNTNTFNEVFCNLASNLVAKLPPPSKRFGLDLSILCNAMIPPFFDYACKAWYPNLNKNLRRCLQAAQNKCIRFCLKLGHRKSVTVKKTEKINWLSIDKRVN